MNKKFFGIIFGLLVCFGFLSCTQPNDSSDTYLLEETIESKKDYVNQFTGYCGLQFSDNTTKTVTGILSYYGYVQGYNPTTKTSEYQHQYRYTWYENDVRYEVTFCFDTGIYVGFSGYSSSNDIPVKIHFCKVDYSDVVISKPDL